MAALTPTIATVTITVNPVDPTNTPPVAASNTYTVNEDVCAEHCAHQVCLGNDTDADGDTLTAIKVSDPAHGTLILNADGSFVYTPNANFNGTDSFTYKANDGSADSNDATVTITVTPVNDPGDPANASPVAVSNTYTVNQDAVLTVGIPGLLGNDTDADGDTLTAVKVSDPAHGTLILNADGSFVYTPNAGFNGTDSFTYKANDGTADSNDATVTITVNPIGDEPDPTERGRNIPA